MNNSFKKECYDANPHFKVHYSHGLTSQNLAMSYLHYDKDMIIEYYRKGEASIHIEGNLYSIAEGDIVILNPDELHVSAMKEQCYIEKIVLHISRSLFDLFSNERAVFFDDIAQKPKGHNNLIPANITSAMNLGSKMGECLEYAAEGSLEAQVLLNCRIIELLAQLADLLKSSNHTTPSPASANKSVNQIIDYINRHYTEDINLDVLAERFHFSKYYISHLFKDYVGISPYDYLIMRRLYTCNNLIRGKHSVKEAALMVGFHNYSNFYRLYKKHFQITPQQFKEQLNET